MNALDLLRKMTAALEIHLVFILSGTDTGKIYLELLKNLRSE